MPYSWDDFFGNTPNIPEQPTGDAKARQKKHKEKAVKNVKDAKKSGGLKGKWKKTPKSRNKPDGGDIWDDQSDTNINDW